MMDELINEAKKALCAFETRGPFDLVRIPTGLINTTFRVKGRSDIYVLQRLHPVFSPAVNQDISTVTAFLQQKKLLTPLLVKTDEGALWAIVDNNCWRMQTLIEGQCFDHVKNPAMAYEAGCLVAQFHRALVDFDYQYQFSRPHAHDTPQFLKRLENALANHRYDRQHEKALPFAEKLLEAGESLPNLLSLPRRHSHGDLKISNILFNSQLRALCLIDLDTLGLLPWPIEMGDAFRSWCNVSGEDTSDVNFDLDIFAAAINGYATIAGPLWKHEEIETLVSGIMTIPLELSVRFLLDVFEDKYWGWDRARFASRAEHNWVRALGQFALYADVVKKVPHLSRMIQQAFASGIS